MRKGIGPLAVAALLLAGASKGDRMRITGKVTILSGHRVPPDRRVRVFVAREFPELGAKIDTQVQASSTGRFSFDKLAPGSYWLGAYIDDDKDKKLTPGHEIMGYATTNPVPLGEGRTSFSAVVDLDPISVQLVTVFEPAHGPAPARRVLESLRVVPLDPKTGKLLEDAEVTVAARKIAFSPAAQAYVHTPDPPEDAQSRYVVEIVHKTYGRAPRKHALAPRVFGAVPDAHLMGTRVEWTSPPWANVSAVHAVAVDGRVLFDGPAKSPLELPELPPGASVRVRVGRIDIQHGGDITISAGDVILKAPWPPAGASAPGGPAAPKAPSAGPPVGANPPKSGQGAGAAPATPASPH